MRKHHAVLVVLTLSLAVAPATGQQAQPTPAEQQAKIRVVMEFYRPGITLEERIALIHRDYQQHNQTYVKYAKDRNISNWQAFAEIRRQQGVDTGTARHCRQRPRPGRISERTHGYRWSASATVLLRGRTLHRAMDANVIERTNLRHRTC